MKGQKINTTSRGRTLCILLVIIIERTALANGSCIEEESDELKDCVINSSEIKISVNCKVIMKSQRKIVLLNPESTALDEKTLELDFSFTIQKNYPTNQSLSFAEADNTSASNHLCLFVDSVEIRKTKNAVSEAPNIYEIKIKAVYNLLININSMALKINFNLSTPVGYLKSWDCDGSNPYLWSGCKGNVLMDPNFFSSRTFSSEEVKLRILPSLASTYLDFWKGKTEYLQMEIDDSAEGEFFVVILLFWVKYAVYPLETVSFANSKLRKIEKFRMPQMDKLQSLQLSNCDLTDEMFYDGSFLSSVNIRYLDLSGNKLKRIPFSLLILRNLKILDISQNKAEDSSFNVTLLENPSFQNLEELNLNGLLLFPEELKYLKSLIHLKVLRLRGCFLNSIPTDFVFPSGLWNVDLSFNNMTYFPKESFQNDSQMVSLDLSHNKLKMERQGEELTDLQSLIHLNLSANNISDLPMFVLNHFPNLLTLQLRGNQLQSWKKRLLTQSNNSKSLDLSSNRISEITAAMMKDFDDFEVVNLENNPFDCGSCELQSFQSWTQNTSVTLKNLPFYKCVFPVSMVKVPLLNATLDEKCLPHIINLWLVVALPLALVLLLMLSVGIVVYRYFDHLQLFCFSLYQGCCRRGVINENQRNFDGFVSYSSKDEDWVLQLIHELEKSPPYYNLCLHHRNFMVGAPVMHQIIDCIESSRRLLFVLSKSFIESHWCEYELKMAQHRLFETGKSNIILIQLEELKIDQLPKSLQHLLRTRRSLLWPTREQKKPLFWAKLRSWMEDSETTDGVELQQINNSLVFD